MVPVVKPSVPVVTGFDPIAELVAKGGVETPAQENVLSEETIADDIAKQTPTRREQRKTRREARKAARNARSGWNDYNVGYRNASKVTMMHRNGGTFFNY